MLWGWEDQAPESRSRVLTGDERPLEPPGASPVRAAIEGSCFGVTFWFDIGLPISQGRWELVVAILSMLTLL